jgi:hypothetical protein
VVEGAIGTVESIRGHDAEAILHQRRELALTDELLDSDDDTALIAANNLGDSLEPFGVGCDSAGDVYVADTTNNRIRLIRQ